MKWSNKISILVFVLLGFMFVSCAPSGPSTLEVIKSFETLANAKDLEGTMELFDENAVYEQSYKGLYIDKIDEIEGEWQRYYSFSQPCEFRDINVDGNKATFIWVELLGLSESLWPVEVEVKNGKITHWDFYEDHTIEIHKDD